MATWYAQKNGAMNDASQWGDNANPAETEGYLSWSGSHAGDSFEENGFATAINCAFTAAALTNANGGSFTWDLNAVNVTVTSDVTASAVPCIVTSGSANPLTLVGTSTGGSAANAVGIKCETATNVSVTNAVGGSNATAYGVGRTANSGSATVTGKVTANTAPGLQAGYQSTITVDGDLEASDSAPAIYPYSSYYTLVLDGNIVCSANGTWPIGSSALGCRLKWTGAADGKVIKYRDGDLAEHSAKLPDYPAEADVKSGTDYDYTALTGTYSAGGGGGVIIGG